MSCRPKLADGAAASKLFLGLVSLIWAACAAHAAGDGLSAAHISEELDHYGIGPLPGRKSLEIPFEFEGQRGTNVIGYLPATAGGESERTKAAILFGTDYADAEAVGLGGAHPTANLAEVVDPATVLLAAKSLATAPLRHPVIVAFWSNRGQSQNGSRAFVGQSGIPASGFLAYVHLDRVGPSPDNRLSLLGAESSPIWRGVVERANVPVGFDIRIEDEPGVRTDASTFHRSEVPAIRVTAGTGGTTPSTAGGAKRPDLEETERLARFAALLVRKLDRLEQRPEFVGSVPEPSEPVQKKRSAYTGTIPDYTAEVEGLRLDGVIEGGPAAQAGLAEGDVIVELAGQPIANIYDYRDLLETVEVGRPIRVIFLRAEERHEVTIVPTVRP